MTGQPGDRLARRLAGLGYGGDYNPEQWPSSVWAQDHALMKEAGVNLVSVGIFAWALVEPRPGVFDLGWFDEVMDGLAGAGVSASLATMTASPPPWLANLHPETLPERADGVRLWPGGRQHYCPSSPVYREHTARLVERLATRYRDHPALALWHIGNEYGVHVADCYCDRSAAAFRRWLQARYGTVDGLNEAWSTRFWSQRYDSFDEVLPPRVAPTFPNPAQRIDYARFSSDELLACYRVEADILRRITPDVPLTTNLLGVWKPVDYHTWAPHLDIISHDAYPDPGDPASAIEAALGYDLMRSLRHGQPWLLMEQAPSAVNWRERNQPKPPGGLRLGSLQAVARGADAVLAFQWRQSRGGAEKFHSAMVPHRGPSSRTYAAVRDLGAELRRLDAVAGSRIRADTALVLDWSSWWGLELDSHPSVDVRQIDSLMAHYRPLFEAGVTTDIVAPTEDLSAYRLVVVPNLYLTDRAAADNLHRYAEAGGHLVISFFSGVVDECDRVHLGGYPGAFRDLCGVHIDEYWPLRAGERIRLDLAPDAPPGLPDESSGGIWSEWIELEGATPVATFATGELAGRPAVTRNAYGRGQVWYLGTRPDEGAMSGLLRAAAREAGAAPDLADLPPMVESVTRVDERGRRYRFVLNHGPELVDVALPEEARDVLAGTGPTRRLRLAPRGVAVLASDP
jgi:beta-galactosidase